MKLSLFLSMAIVSEYGKNIVSQHMEQYKKENNINFKLYEKKHGSFLIFDNTENTENICEYLSNILDTSVMYLHVHNSSFWMYLLFKSGEVIDIFNPIPDYWGELLEEEYISFTGDADKICSCFSWVNSEDIKEYLKFWTDDMEDTPWSEEINEQDNKQIKYYAYPDDEFSYNNCLQFKDFLRKLTFDYPKESEETDTITSSQENIYENADTEKTEEEQAIGVLIEWAWIPEKSFNDVNKAITKWYKENIKTASPIFQYYEINSDKDGSFILFSNKTFGMDIAESLSKGFQSLVLYFRVQEQKSWLYTLFESGNIIDGFIPIMEYFDETESETSFWNGNSKLFSKFFMLNEESIKNYYKIWTEENYGLKSYSTDEYGFGDYRQISDFFHKMNLPFLGEEKQAKLVNINKYPEQSIFPDKTSIDIGNWKLFNSINKTLGIRVSKKYDLIKLKKLDLSKMRFEKASEFEDTLAQGDFSALKYAENLKDVDLSDNYINDFSVISECRNIQKLKLSHCGFEDCSVLKNLNNLTFLDLSYNPSIVNLSTLEKLPKLKKLVIDKMSLNGYDAEKYLSNIDITYLRDYILPVVKLDESVQNIIFSRENGNNENNKSEFQKMFDEKLREPNFYEKLFRKLIPKAYENNKIGSKAVKQKIRDFRELKCNDTLIYLEAETGSSIKGIEVLKKYTKLETLLLKDMGITDISFVKAMENLKELDISFNNISDISYLKNLKNLEILYITGNPIEDISVINELPNLSGLYADVSQIPDKELFNNMPDNLYVQVLRKSKWASEKPLMEKIPNFSDYTLKDEMCPKEMNIYSSTILQDLFLRDRKVLKYFIIASKDMTCYRCSSASKETIQTACYMHKIDQNQFINQLRWYFYLKEKN